MSGSVAKKSENLPEQQDKDELPLAKPSNKAKEDDTKNELSEEDKALKEELEFCVKILSEPDKNLYKNALECIRKHIRSSTTSMTSVPKPLKFMRPHYNTMKEICDRIVDEPTKLLCCDIISVLAMTIDETQDCLKYRLIGTPGSVGDWGHEYIRHLTSEIVSEWEFAMDDTDGSLAYVKKLETLIKEIVPFCMSHNAETEACDLLIEVERLEYLDSVIDENSYSRVCLYLVSCAPYVSTSDAAYLLKHAIKYYWRFKETIHAVRLAIQMNDTRMVRKFFAACTDPLEKKQIAFILANHRSYVNVDPLLTDFDCGEILSNSLLSIHFLNTARELDVMEPKTPEEVYKSHLEVSRSGFLGSSQVDSARQNLAASFVNGFVNAGFCRDKLLCEDGNKWLFRNKEHGMFSAAASFGLILLWDIDGGLTRIDKYLYSADEYIKGGTLMSCGILNSSVNSDCDPALALLNDYVLSTSTVMRIGAISGLGIAYAGTNNDSVLHVLLPALTDSKSTMEVVGITSLACGMITVGHANVEFTETLIQVLMEKSALELKDTFSRFIALGLALTHLGQKDSISTIKEAVSFVQEPLKSMLGVMLEACAYVGTGHVLKVQQFLHLCSEHHSESSAATAPAAAAAPAETSTAAAATATDTSSDVVADVSATPKAAEKDEKAAASSAKSKEKEKGKDKDKDKEKSSRDKEEKEKELFSKQAMAVIGIALISMGEDIGSEMVFRHFGHLIRYCEGPIRRAVPLALGIISVSNPKLNIIETLGKFSHDTDQEVAYNAIFAMGLVGAGTNNSRLAAMLRQLAQFYAKEPNSLFMVRIAQGLTHMGKGMLTLNPYHSDRQLLSYVSISAIIATVVAFLDVKNIILGKSHYLLYMLTPAIQPRLLITLDEQLNPLPVPVRVGLAVDVVGQAGKPKTITGFQTHTTPVLLNHGERAELATDQYISVSPVMEGTVILRKNPHYDGIVDFKK